MAIKKEGITTENGIEKFTCNTTDLKATWPTTCAIGSIMTVTDDTAETVYGIAYFNGTKWCYY